MMLGEGINLSKRKHLATEVLLWKVYCVVRKANNSSSSSRAQIGLPITSHAKLPGTLGPPFDVISLLSPRS